jgi:hypothetical protein
MALTVLLSEPQNTDISVPIDTKLKLIFSKPVDKFTVLNGITLYSIGAQQWTGSLLSSKDSLTSDVKSDAGQIDVIDFSVEISGANVDIYPTQKLKQTTQYFLQVAPGNDPTRFTSAQTTDTPIYSVAASGQVHITSAYTGNVATTFQLIFTSATDFDLMVGGIFKDSYSSTLNIPVLLNKEISVSIGAGFIANDTATFNVYPAEGLATLCKIAFTTSNYEETAPKSIKIEDKLYANVLNELKIINTIPAPWSMNNQNVNPIIIKFNRDIDSTQDLLEKIKIHKLNIETGDIKKIKFIPELAGNVLKLYMQSVLKSSEISDNAIYDLDIDKLTKIGSLNYIV